MTNSSFMHPVLKKILIFFGLLFLAAIVGSFSIGSKLSKILWDEERIELALAKIGLQTSDIMVSTKNHGLYSTSTVTLIPINTVFISEIKINATTEHGPVLIDQGRIGLGLALSHNEIEITYSDDGELRTFTGLKSILKTDFLEKNTGKIWLDNAEATYDQLRKILQIKSIDKIELEGQFDFDTVGVSSKGYFRLGPIEIEKSEQASTSYSFDEIYFQWNNSKYEGEYESSHELTIKVLEVNAFDVITAKLEQAHLTTSIQNKNDLANAKTVLLLEGVEYTPFSKNQKESPVYRLNIKLNVNNIRPQFLSDSTFFSLMNSTGARADTFSEEDMLNSLSNLELDSRIELSSEKKADSLLHSKLDIDFSFNDELPIDHSKPYNLEEWKEKIDAVWELKIDKKFLSTIWFFPSISGKVEALVKHQYIQSTGDYLEIKARLKDGSATSFDRKIEIDELTRLMANQSNDGESERPIDNNSFRAIEDKKYSTNVNDFFAEYDGTGKYSGRTRSGDNTPFVNSNTIGWIEGAAGGFKPEQIKFFKNNLSIGNGDPVRLDKAELQFLEEFNLVRFINRGANIKVAVTEFGMAIMREFPKKGKHMSLEDYIRTYQTIGVDQPATANSIVKCITKEGQTLFQQGECSKDSDSVP